MLHLVAVLLTLSRGLPSDMVFTLRAEVQPGSIELSSAAAISPDCAVALAVFPASCPISVETPEGIFQPESIVCSPDLGLHILFFGERIFDASQPPCEEAPGAGDKLTIVGQGLSGLLSIEGTATMRYPDGAILLTAPFLDGMMGAAVFDSENRLVGLITGILEVQDGPLGAGEEYLVLYPSQIWYMWAQLACDPGLGDAPPFGVTAMASISFDPDRPSGIQLVSVAEGSEAWRIGLRPGDLISAIDGHPVFHPETLRGLRILSCDTLETVVWSHGVERLVAIPPVVTR